MRDASKRGMRDTDAPSPTLPAWKAFVVQFARDARPQGPRCAGRIEHLSSGRRVHFESVEQMVAALDQLLAELGERDH